jgi:hypothetical protein
MITPKHDTDITQHADVCKRQHVIVETNPFALEDTNIESKSDDTCCHEAKDGKDDVYLDSS